MRRRTGKKSAPAGPEDEVAFETERLVGLEPEERDLPFLARLQADADVMRYVTARPRTAEEVREKLVEYRDHWRRHGTGFAILYRKTGLQPVGYGGFRWLETLGAYEIGCVLDKPHWKDGLGTELARALLDKGFGEMKLPQILAMVEKTNQRSTQLCEKLGMTLLSYGNYEGLSCKLFGVDREAWLSGTPDRFVPFDDQ